MLLGMTSRRQKRIGLTGKQQTFNGFSLVIYVVMPLSKAKTPLVTRKSSAKSY